MADTPPVPPPPDSGGATQAFPPDPPDPQAPTLSPTGADRGPAEVEGNVPGYEVLGEVGRGGMGVVYRARQLALNRTVALKMILAGTHAAPEDLARFRSEAEAMARLHHPHIVQIHEVGTHNGLPFFSLEFCERGSLEERLGGTPLPPRDAAGLIETLARAMQAAHDKGVIHRDLKPANVLFAEDGTPKVTDFGLAKKLDEQSHTRTGAVMGTPSYMAPEQASGHREVGPPADVYALGVLLYECLTGRPPFRAATALDTLMQVVADDPVPPRRLVPSVPRDLETICLKCLQKDPHRRYGSAAGLADDLGRWLSGEPIRARPVRVWERALKWARRRPAVAGLLFLCALTAVTAFALVTWKWQEAAAAHERAMKANYQAMRQRRQAQENLYFNTIALADREWANNNRRRAAELLRACEGHLRGWEWERLRHLTRSATHTFAGTGLLTVGLAYSPDGRRLACPGPDHTLHIREVESGKLLETVKGLPRPPGPVAFHPDGERLAVAVGDPEEKEPGAVVFGKPGEAPAFVKPVRFPTLTSLCFSPDGRWLAGGSGGDPRQGGAGEVVVWDVATGQEVLLFASPEGAVAAAAFSPDGQLLAGAVLAYHRPQGTIRLWEVPSGKELPPLVGHEQGITSVAFDPEGKLLASASLDRTVKLWDLPRRAEVRTLHGARAAVTAVAFSPDGLEVAGGGLDKAVHVWETDSGKEVYTIRGHAGSLARVAYRPDGRQIAALAGLEMPGQGTVETALWDATRDPEVLVFPGHVGMTASLAQSPDGKTLASAGFDTRLRLWDVASRRLTAQIPVRPGMANAVAFHPEGQTLAAVIPDGQLALLSPTGEVRQRLAPAPGPLRQLTFHRSGRYLALGVGHPFSEEPGPITFWDLRENKSQEVGKGWAVAFHAPRGQLVLGGPDHTIEFRSLRDLRNTRTLSGHEGIVSALAPSPDGKTLASGAWDGTVRLWDMNSGEVRHVLRGHSGHVCSVAFSPDGERLVSASLSADQAGGGEIKVWDPETGKEALTLDGNVRAFFSPAGDRLAGIKTDFFRQSELRVWETTPPPPLEPDDARQALLDWHRDRLERAAQVGRFAGATVHADRLLDMLPESSPLWAARGFLRGAQGRWQEADADYGRALELGSTTPNNWFRRGLVLLLMDDRDGYRRHCAHVLKQFGTSDQPARQIVPAWACKLSPGALDDYAVAVRQAEHAVASAPGNTFHLNNLGGILHRAGRHEEAIRRLEESLRSRKDSDPVWDWIWLALAHRQLGHRDEARKWFDQARAWIDGPDFRRLNWVAQRELRLLLAEAAGRIEKPEPPPAR